MVDREPDELDQASLATQEEVEAVISVIRANLQGESSAVCIDCDQPIPAERLRAARALGIAVQRCVDCAAARERWHALHPGAEP